MQEQQYIAADIFCVHHNIEFSFIESLHQHGLIEIKTVEQRATIPAEQLPVLEKMIHLHFDMDINVEGIETIQHLLQRVEEMQSQIQSLKNRLGLYEMPE